MFFFSNKSCSVVDITGSYIDQSSDEDDNGRQVDEPKDKEDNDSDVQVKESSTESQSYQVLDGSVLVTPSKGFQSDTCSSESDCADLNGEGNDNSDGDDLNETKYVSHTDTNVTVVNSGVNSIKLSHL